jgi:hypothetical protein
VVEAGASYAEAQDAGLPEDLRPPLMKDFAAKMWRDYNPHFLLSEHLRQLGHDPGADARERFVELERIQAPNVTPDQHAELAVPVRRP